ncbi:MAG: RidA family protein [Gemmatimonadota bacterium]
MSARREIRTERAPAAIGPYSQGILSENLLYSAGQIGLDPATGELVGPGIEEQTRQVLENLGAVLSAAGLGFGDVVKTTVYLADMAEFAVMNDVYEAYFPEPCPARSTVEVRRLPRDARVEVELVARGA